jgi:hypothetical protein
MAAGQSLLDRASADISGRADYPNLQGNISYSGSLYAPSSGFHVDLVVFWRNCLNLAFKFAAVG